MRAAARRRWAILGLAGPAYLWLTLTIFLPLSAMLVLSFLDRSPLFAGPMTFTWRNYATFLEKPFYLTLAWWSLVMGFWTVLFCLLLGYPAAYVLARHVKGRWREAIFLLVVLPFWSSALVRVFSWTMVLRRDGLLDIALREILPGLPALDLLFTYPAVIIGLVHSYLPYMILTCYIALAAIDERLLEAARSLGAKPFAVFRRIVLPLSLPGLLSGAVLIFVPAIGSFMEPRVLGGTKGATLGMNIEEQFTVTANWPLGAALSFILLFILLFLAALPYPFLRRHRPAVAA